jgi:hypothetical protein
MLGSEKSHESCSNADFIKKCTNAEDANYNKSGKTYHHQELKYSEFPLVQQALQLVNAPGHCIKSTLRVTHQKAHVNNIKITSVH